GLVRDAERPEAVRELALLRSPRAVLIPTSAEVEGHAADGILVADECVVRVQLRYAEEVPVRTIPKAADLRRRRRIQLHRRRRAARADGLEDVGGGILRVSEPAGFEQQLAAELEVVRAAPAVLEVCHRPGQL